MQFPGQEGDFSWIFNILFFAFFIGYMLYGAKLQIRMWLGQIRAGLVELKRMRNESKESAIETFKAFGRTEEEVTGEVERWLDYFTIMPVDLDPAGVLKRLDHLLDERRDRFQEFVSELAPEATPAQQQTLENTLEVSQVLDLIYRIVRHFYILGSKTG
ncbi:MAG: DUF1512 family protein, partial [Candidatus Thorarchaeota archaeon]